MTDGFLKKKNLVRFLLHSKLELKREFKVSSQPQSADCFVMEKIQLREILDLSLCLSSPQSI